MSGILVASLFSLAAFPFISKQMALPNLTTNSIYEVKVRAASISIINPRQIILGSYSEPKKVIREESRSPRDSMFSIIGISFFLVAADFQTDFVAIEL